MDLLWYYALVAQLDRALDSDSKGRTFKSCRAYQKDVGQESVFELIPAPHLFSMPKSLLRYHLFKIKDWPVKTGTVPNFVNLNFLNNSNFTVLANHAIL